MSVAILAIFTTIFATLPAHAATVLILGDSLSASYGMDKNEGWVEKLKTELPQHTIINASVSGETTAGGLRRLPSVLKSSRPDLVLIELGGNDGLRGFSTKKLKSNLTKLISLSERSGAKVLMSEVMVPPNYGPRYSKSFNAVYHDIADDENIMLMPFFMTEIAPNPQLMQRDGIHPNQKAQSRIVEFIKPWIEKALKK
ncbi:arylesterase [Parashewanella tropica]|uniref:arylesterase n=1 Tax=Parashewanella tropica TaxID=2547970 RepID=UPI001FE67399|nr:arylesterase [Parashewanella tropica]